MGSTKYPYVYEISGTSERIEQADLIFRKRQITVAYQTSSTKYIWDIDKVIGREVFSLEIEEMRNINVTKVEPENLVDIRRVKVNSSQNREGKVKDFVRQIKNPYCYRYGDYIVKIGFEDTTVTLADRLKEMIMKAADSA